MQYIYLDIYSYKTISYIAVKRPYFILISKDNHNFITKNNTGSPIKQIRQYEINYKIEIYKRRPYH